MQGLRPVTAASGADREQGCFSTGPGCCGRPGEECAVHPIRRSSGADQPTLRDQLAEALTPHACIVTSGGLRCDCGWKWQGGEMWTAHRWDDPEPAKAWREHQADALLPLIDPALERAKAEALERVAAIVHRVHRDLGPKADLWAVANGIERDATAYRAASLRATTGRPE